MLSCLGVLLIVGLLAAMLVVFPPLGVAMIVLIGLVALTRVAFR